MFFTECQALAGLVLSILQILTHLIITPRLGYHYYSHFTDKRKHFTEDGSSEVKYLTQGDPTNKQQRQDLKQGRLLECMFLTTIHTLPPQTFSPAKEANLQNQNNMEDLLVKINFGLFCFFLWVHTLIIKQPNKNFFKI